MKKDNKQQEIQTNKLLLVFVMVFLGIFGAMCLNKMSDKGATFMIAYNTINILSGVTAITFVLSGFRHLSNVRANKKSHREYFNSKSVFCISTVALACFTLVQFVSIFSATKYIYIFLTGVAILYFILVTYSKEVFVIAITNILTIATTYLLAESFGSSYFYIIAGVLILALVAVFVVVKNAQKDNGKVFKYEFFTKETNYKLLNLNMLVLVLITILSILLAFIGFNYGYTIAIIYFMVVIFHNTIKIL